MKRGDEWVSIDKPDDATFGTYDGLAIVQLLTDWTVGGKSYKGGSMLVEGLDAYLKGERKFEVLFEPSDRKSLESSASTKNFLVLNELENVCNRLYSLHR
jgi:prolyl oligopeptidase